MKTLVLVFALCAVAFALPRPASEEQESKESNESKEDVLFVVPLERAMPPRGRFGGFGLNPFEQTHPFEQHPFFRGGLWGRPELEAQPEQDDFMTQMQEMLKEMRKQLTDLMQHAHHGLPGGVHGEEGGDAEAVGTRIGGGEAEQDLPQNKTTSTTKVIDGHVVTVNETTYSSGDEGLGAVFRIKIVEVKPSESPETEGENKEPEEESKDTEGEEKTSEEPSSPEREPTTSKAELPDPEEDRHEETNEIPNHTQVHEEWAEEFDPSNNEIVSQEWDEEGPRKESYYDLRDDTRVNDFVSDHDQNQGLVMLEPDAELVEANNRQYYHYQAMAMPQRMQAFAR